MKNHSRRGYILHLFIFLLLFIGIALLFIFLSYRLINNSYHRQASNDSQIAPVVIIDAGHGGEDGGAIGVNGAFEKDINLSIAKKIRSYLESRNIRCVLTREEDILLYDRTQNYQGRKKVLDMQASISSLR